MDRAPRQWRGALSILARGAEPAGAALRLLALPESLRRNPIATAFARLLHQGSYPARLCTLVPEAVSVLDDPGADDDAEPLGPDPDPDAEDGPLSARAIADALRSAVTRHGVDDAVGRLRTREYLRLARREVEAAPLERVGSDLSALAAGIIQALLEHAGIDQQVVVFGMGKLGGNELNFLSDIDLLFVHADADDSEADPRTAVIELHAKLRRVVRHLEGAGRWRPVFRVDLRLRPFGTRGPLSMSTSATESYYERHGRPWERQAWLRARPIAGNKALGQEVQRRLRPFVYRRTMSASIFEEIRHLMARARRESVIVVASDVGANAGTAGINLKFDEGGIRTIEFAVQALQLMHAGKNSSLRSPSTLRALDRLLAAGLVSDREHAELTDAYRFFRRVEHRVQLAQGQQTHVVPADDAQRRLLALRLGVSPSPSSAEAQSGSGPDPLAAFDARIAEHRARATAIAATMAGDEPEDRGPVAKVLDSGAPPHVRREALAQLGFRDPDDAEALLSHMFARDEAALTTRGPAGRGAERLLAACLDSADPDMALVRFARFSRDRPAHYGIWRLFAEPPDVGWDLPRMTAELFGTSEALSAGLIGFPVGRGALPDDAIAVLQAVAEHPLKDAKALGAAMLTAPVDPRGIDATLLRFKHQQLVRIGIHDLSRRPDPLVVGRVLSDLADRIMRTVIRDLAAEPSWRGGPRLNLAVLAAGKYGTQGMDYGSDLDLVFVYGAPDGGASTAEAGAVATRFAQRLVGRLSDRALGIRLYEIDTRLRPSGRQGLLVTSAAAFDRYHARALPVWEKLAMLRMRAVAEVQVGAPFCAPDASAAAEATGQLASAIPGPLSATAEAVVSTHLFSGPGEVSTSSLGTALGDLKRRIEREIGRETRGHFNAKAGLGACLELELLISALQLQHGRDAPGLRCRSIAAAIEALGVAGALPKTTANALSATYGFQRLLLNRLRMSHAGGFDDPDRFSENSPKLPTLARRMGLPDVDALISRYHASRSVVRSALVSLLPDCKLPLPFDPD